jgi:tryptophan synthase alpha chain
MPPEESQELKRILSNSEIDFIFLVAPTTTDERLKFLSQVASGFIYFVSLKGVTGAGNINVDEVASNLSRIRKYISLPVGVGFGIKDGKTAKEISAKSDAIIVGSVLVSIVDEFSNDKNKLMSQMKEKSLEISQVLR